MSGFEITLAPPGDPDAAALTNRHLALMASQSPAESCHAMDLSGPERSDSRLFLLRRDGVAIAMGALKALEDGALELKSMHTVSEARGLGAGRAMLEHLLSLARRESASGVYLETGSTDDYIASRRLYAAYGFIDCPPFANYVKDQWSSFMHLDLRSTA